MEGVWKRRALVLVPAVVALVAHWTCLNNPFVFDDFETVVNNPSIKSPIKWAFVFVYSIFRPVANASYALDRIYMGTDPFGFHLTNLILHAANCVIVFLLAEKLFDDVSKRQNRPIQSWIWALVAACLFAVHPLMTQAVGYVSQRTELLCLFWGGLGCLALHRARWTTWLGWKALALLSFALAVLSKESAAMALFVVWAYDGLFLRDLTQSRIRRFYLPVATLVGVGALIRTVSLKRFEGRGLPGTVWENLLLQAEVVWRYVALFFFPSGQSLVHEVEIPSPARAALFIFLWASVGLTVFFLRRAWPAGAFGIATFLLFMLASSGVVPLMEGMAEHRTYVAGVGLFIAFSACLETLFGLLKSSSPWKEGAIGVLTLGLVFVLSWLTHRRYEIWRDPISLWTEAVEGAPKMWATHYALADAYRMSGKCAQALGEYQRAIVLRGDDERAPMNLGICLAELGRLKESEEEFRRVVALKPKNAAAYLNLAHVAYLQNDRKKALEWLEKSMALEPENSQALSFRKLLSQTNPQ